MSEELDRLENTKHANKELMEASNASRKREEKPMSPQIHNDATVANTIQPPMGCQNQNDKQTQTGEIENLTGNDWWTEVKLSENHNTGRARF